MICNLQYFMYSSASILPCVAGADMGLTLMNKGNVPFDLTYTLNFDPLLTAENTSWGEAPSEILPGQATWTISSIQPGEYHFLVLHIDGQGVEYVGDTFDFASAMTLTPETGDPANLSWVESLLVSCAYDPNDKQADPIGYAEPHYILGGERIQYSTRFQNTSNAAATDVLIIDTLDTNLLDLSTFEVGYGTAQFYTCLHDDGLLEFMFFDINLPDSVSNEPESHGLVSFSIEPP